MPSPTQITINQLNRQIGLPDAPRIIDVRIDEDFDAMGMLIPGAIRAQFNNITQICSRLLPGDRAVVYCHKGRKISQGAAALMRHRGIGAETLEGGIMAWAEAGMPLVPVQAIPKRDAEGDTVWVTRHRPKIDRVACPWLIRRFVDPYAKFLFVEPGEVKAVSEKFGATPFDIEGVTWSHKGPLCTFDTMVEGFGLNTDPLARLAEIIRGADTDRHELAPQCAGLLAVLLGLSRMYRDDLRQLDAAMAVLDAFYRWARDAHEETHDWPAAPGGKP